LPLGDYRDGSQGHDSHGTVRGVYVHPAVQRVGDDLAAFQGDIGSQSEPLGSKLED
jgi:hypothetical protein